MVMVREDEEGEGEEEVGEGEVGRAAPVATPMPAIVKKGRAVGDVRVSIRLCFAPR